MLASVVLALFLPCAGMSAVFIVYLCLLWYAAKHNQNETDHHFQSPVKPVTNTGLSDSELEKLPKITRKELVMGTECAVCLDEIEEVQPARLLPGCNHGFHLECADTWLSKNRVCPVCRAKLEPEFFSSGPEENPC
ncbi:hypothetical protein UlMin_034022 [Ulmus minor]